MQVLVVDNNHNSAKISTYLLKDYGATVKIASSVEEVIKILDLLVPDLLIVEKKYLYEGIHVLKNKLRNLEVRIERHIPVIFSSAAYSTDDTGVGEFTDSININLLQDLAAIISGQKEW
jgi:CheY-like chemotaxis protein